MAATRNDQNKLKSMLAVLEPSTHDSANLRSFASPNKMLEVLAVSNQLKL
jgi:hypothetical protein